MKDLKKKSIPFPYWHTDYFESWLSNMSKEGLLLVQASERYCKFRKTTPKNNSYRIEIAEKDDQLPSTTIQKYRDNRWNLICNAGKFYIFCSENEYLSSDVYIDNEAYLKMLSKYIHRIYGGAALTILILTGFILLLMNSLSAEFSHLNFIMFLITISIATIVSLIPLIIMLLSTMSDCFYVQRLKRKLKNNCFIDHHRPWKRHKFIYLLRHYCYVIIIILITAYSLFNSTSNDFTPYSISEIKKLPIITAFELSNTTNYDKTSKTYIRHRKAILSDSYRLTTRGISDPYSDNSYNCTLENYYYKLTFSNHTEDVTDWLISDNCLDNYSKISDSSYFNDIYIQEYNGGFKIILTKDSEVWYIDYFGHKDYQDIIDCLQKKLSQIQ